MRKDTTILCKKDIILDGESDAEIKEKQIEDSNDVLLSILYEYDPYHVNILEAEYGEEEQQDTTKLFFIQDKDGVSFIEEEKDSLEQIEMDILHSAINLLQIARGIIGSQS